MHKSIDTYVVIVKEMGKENKGTSMMHPLYVAALVDKKAHLGPK